MKHKNKFLFTFSLFIRQLTIGLQTVKITTKKSANSSARITPSFLLRSVNFRLIIAAIFVIILWLVLSQLL